MILHARKTRVCCRRSEELTSWHRSPKGRRLIIIAIVVTRFSADSRGLFTAGDPETPGGGEGTARQVFGSKRKICRRPNSITLVARSCMYVYILYTLAFILHLLKKGS